MEDLIEKFHLLPHPEGGFYRETYRSEQNVLTVVDDDSVDEVVEQQKQQHQRERSACTAIYFLISPGNISRLHRIKSDEIWHFYLGSPLTIIEIGKEFLPNNFKETVLGQDIGKGQLVQCTVKRGTWFGCYPNANADHDDTQSTSSSVMMRSMSNNIYSFVGCTVAPGFEFKTFEVAASDWAPGRDTPLAAEMTAGHRK